MLAGFGVICSQDHARRIFLFDLLWPEPYPVVDWTNVRFKPDLPSPQDLSLLSASKDPEFYQLQKGIYNTSSPSKFSSEEPFGTLPGYRTTQGIVSVPASPVQGYIFCPTSRKWILHASLNTRRRPAAGKGCPGTSGGERERGKKPHYLP
jgi:hypothetical protein